MKKFMRIALVFALAGAALVGCTKDYSGDISDLNKQVSGIQSTLTSLQTSVQSAQSAADAAAATANTALSAAKEAASAADLKAVQTALAAAATSADLTAVDAKYAAYIPAIEAAAKAADLEALETTITAAIAATDVKVADLEKALEAYAKKADLDEAVTKLAALETNYIALEARVAKLEAAEKEIRDLIAENKDDIEANAEAIEALKEKIEELLAQSAQLVSLDIVEPTDDDINVGYAEFKGVFEIVKGKWTASTWEGEREVPAKGTFVSSINNGTLVFQVNPTDYVLAGEDLEIINKNGEVAPFVFSDPVEHTFPTTKAGAGFYASKFSTISDLDKDAIKEYTKAFPEETEVALRAHNVVSKFNRIVSVVPTNKDSEVTFKFDCFAVNEKGIEEPTVVDINKTMPEKITVVPKTGEEALYDAYILGVEDTRKAKADSIKYGLSFDGMNFSYDADAVKKEITATAGKDEPGSKDFKVRIAYINNSGYIRTATATVTFKQFAKANPEHEIHDEFVLSTAATYQAKVLKSTATEWKEQVTVDITEALKEWGLDDVDSDARILWDDTTRKYSVVDAYSYDANDPNETITQIKLFEVAANFAVDSKKKTQNVTITFDDKYGDPNEEFDPIVKGGTVYVKVELANATDKYYVVIPVEISAINPTEYFTWNGTNNFADGVLTIHETGTEATKYFALKDAFKLKDAKYAQVVALNQIDSLAGGKATIAVEGQATPNYDSWLRNQTTEPKQAAKDSALWKSGDKNAVRMSNTEWRQFNGTEAGTYIYYYELTSKANVELGPRIKWTNTIDNKCYNHAMTVNGLSVTIYGRTFKLDPLKFQIYKKTFDWTIDPVDIVLSSSDSVRFYNAALAPSFGQTGGFAGSFSLSYGGKVVVFNPGMQWTGSNYSDAVKTTITYKNDEGKYVALPTNGLEGLAGVRFFSYKTGWSQTTAYGFTIIPDGKIFTSGKTYELKLHMAPRNVTTKWLKYVDGSDCDKQEIEIDLSVTVKN